MTHKGCSATQEKNDCNQLITIPLDEEEKYCVK